MKTRIVNQKIFPSATPLLTIALIVLVVADVMCLSYQLSHSMKDNVSWPLTASLTALFIALGYAAAMFFCTWRVQRNNKVALVAFLAIVVADVAILVLLGAFRVEAWQTLFNSDSGAEPIEHQSPLVKSALLMTFALAATSVLSFAQYVFGHDRTTVQAIDNHFGSESRRAKLLHQLKAYRERVAKQTEARLAIEKKLINHDKALASCYCALVQAENHLAVAAKLNDAGATAQVMENEARSPLFEQYQTGTLTTTTAEDAESPAPGSQQ